MSDKTGNPLWQDINKRIKLKCNRQCHIVNAPFLNDTIIRFPYSKYILLKLLCIMRLNVDHVA